MSNQKNLFFTLESALEAVRGAFHQYPCEMNLLSVLWPVVFGADAYLFRGNAGPPVWAKIPGERKLVPSAEPELKRRILERLEQSPPEADGLARIASLVFGVCAKPGVHPDRPDQSGIWVKTDMAGFVCIRCGRCCRRLDYRDGCTLADYARWRASQRTDILAWVGTVRRNGRVVACRIWMVPGTNEYAETCPWLRVSHEHGRYDCSIHDVRPTVCRQYPGSRKHARMTGCKGV